MPEGEKSSAKMANFSDECEQAYKDLSAGKTGLDAWHLEVQISFIRLAFKTPRV